jgi:hypothetical protein
VGNGHLEKGQGGDGRDLGMRHGRGVHDNALVVRGRFGGTGSTDGTHGSARAGGRTGGQADERGPRDRESKRACAEKIDTDKSAPLGSER